MSVATVLSLVLVVGFLTTALVGFFGWRQRMRVRCPRESRRRRPRPVTASERETIQYGCRRSMLVTIALIIVGFLALVVAIIAVHDLTQRKHAVTRNFPGDRTLPVLLRGDGATAAPVFLRGRPRRATVQPRHAFMGVRVVKGAEQLRWVRIPGRSQRTRTDAHPAVDVPDAHASRTSEPIFRARGSSARSGLSPISPDASRTSPA